MKGFDKIPYFKKVGAIGTAVIFGIEGKRITRMVPTSLAAPVGSGRSGAGRPDSQ